MSQDKKVHFVTYTALFTAFSAIISLVEGIFVPSLILPGVKLGLSSLGALCAFYLVGAKCSLCVAVVRPILVFLFSGNVFSLCMALCGSIMSFCSLLSSKKFCGKYISFIGVCALSATFHCTGQTVCGVIITQSGAFWSYFPVFCGASCIAGILSGIVTNIIMPKLSMAFGNTVEKENSL